MSKNKKLLSMAERKAERKREKEEVARKARRQSELRHVNTQHTREVLKAIRRVVRGYGFSIRTEFSDSSRLGQANTQLRIWHGKRPRSRALGVAVSSSDGFKYYNMGSEGVGFRLSLTGGRRAGEERSRNKNPHTEHTLEWLLWQMEEEIVFYGLSRNPATKRWFWVLSASAGALLMGFAYL